MRLRRLEFIIIGITLAFVCFMGGFFTGRSWSAVNITAVANQGDSSYGVGVTITSPATPTPTPTAPPAQDGTTDQPQTPPLTETQTPPNENQNTEKPPEIGAPSGGDGKININRASQTELTDLPGIGSVLASRIIDYRRQHGDFGRIEDLRNVSGIGEKRYEAIQDKITIGN